MLRGASLGASGGMGMEYLVSGYLIVTLLTEDFLLNSYVNSSCLVDEKQSLKCTCNIKTRQTVFRRLSKHREES